MSTKTSNGISVPMVLIGIVAVGMAASALFGRGSGESRPARQDTEEHIVVTVEAIPWPRKITVMVTVEGVQLNGLGEGTILPHSPWAHDFWIPRGAAVGVHVWQESAGTSACSISSNGIVVDSRATMDSPASVRCHHNRKRK